MNCCSAQQAAILLQTVGCTVYLVGAGGCGMSGLGHLLLDLGYKVAGSDLILNPEVQQLRSRGAEIHTGHGAEQLLSASPALVVYSSAIPLNNSELTAAAEKGIPIVRRAVLLELLLQRQRGICVAGMHGKTTTAALLAFALEQLESEPSYAVGALVPQLQPHARFRSVSGSGTSKTQPFFVIEADESDGSLCEFHPEHAIVLNIDEEHLDYFANLDAICREFRQFSGQTTGSLVFCADDARLAQLFASHPRAISYGYHPLSAYRIVPKAQAGVASVAENGLGSVLQPEPAVEFEIWRKGERLQLFQIRLLGEKNVSNAAAVIALLHQIGFHAEKIARAIAPFRGAARRQQELFRDQRFRIFDDYGHHPSEIRATLRALKGLGGRRLLVVFQPHRYTRTQSLLSQFATCFADADRVWLTEVYAASEAEIPGVNGAALANEVRKKGQPVEFIPALERIPGAVRAAMQPGDVVLFLGAGDITKAAHALAAELGQESPDQKERDFTELAGRLSPKSVLRKDEPLAKRTTLRVGGPADFYVEPASEAELAQVLQFCAERRLPFLLLGRGSNLLIKDGGIRGVVICLASAQFTRVEVLENRLLCGAGVKLKAVAVEARRNAITGLEFLEGIPGSIGGALRMNAGAMGAWIFEFVETIRFMDFSGQIHERKASEVYVEYRGCPLFKTHIALGAVLKGEPAPREAIGQRMNAFSQKRWASQPAAPSAGCIFKNPPAIPAGKLIDELGLKGTRVGGAVVSDVHGNFIVNEGHATALDVLRLIDTIKQTARASRGIELETEVEVVGESIEDSAGNAEKGWNRKSFLKHG